MLKVLKYLPSVLEIADTIDDILKGTKGVIAEVRPSIKGIKLRITIERI